MSTNLGTAYVSVMPSMQGFSKAVESNLSGIDTTSAGTAMGSKAASGFAGGMAKNGVVIGAASALASKAFDAVASNADRAISRVDTMQNFPKVMKNLGISADDAEAAVNKVSDGLMGLPTALDQGVAAVQRFTSYNGDVAKSADMFLAVNDAILAGGAPAQMQATALEQLTQAYTKGKMDIQEWRSLQQTMPAQLKQVADAMGMTTEQLGAGLRQSEKDINYLRDVSMDEFIDTIMKLDKEGGAGLASFSEQAKDATTGIQTAIANFNTAIARGTAELINSVGQENISGAINTVSSKIGGIANDLSGDIKVATQFLKEHEEEIGAVVDTMADLAPMAIRAWGAMQLFKGGKAILSGIAGGAEALIGKMGSMGNKAQGLGFAMKEAGVMGAQAMYDIGGIASDAALVFGSMSMGATALTGGLVAGMAALYAYNQSLREATYNAHYLGEEQLTAIATVHSLADSYASMSDARSKEITVIDQEFEKINELKDEYNSLVDANGEIISGNEERANQIIGEIAGALGIEEGAVRNLIGAYGELGDAADTAIRKRKLEKLIESGEDDYATSVQVRDQAAVTAADLANQMANASQRSAEYAGQYASSMEDASKWVQGTPEALGYVGSQYTNLADTAKAYEDRLKTLSEEQKNNAKTLAESSDAAMNYERMVAAASSESADIMADAEARVTYNVKNAENNTRESLQAQVDDFKSKYANMKDAIDNGAQGMDESFKLLGLALKAAEDELAEYDAIQLKEKVASAKIEEGSLIVAQDHVYQWNGSDLVDLGSTADVEDSGLLDAQDNVYTWNGTHLESKSASVWVNSGNISSVISAWENWYPSVKTAVVQTIGSLFAAQGGFYQVHASGGFITNGPTVLGRDDNGIVHIAGEDGREWVQEHADGTTSIIPIENRKYLTPYADLIASMIYGDMAKNVTGHTGDVYNINVYASGDGDEIARTVTKAIRAQNLMKGRR